MPDPQIEGVTAALGSVISPQHPTDVLLRRCLPFPKGTCFHISGHAGKTSLPQLEAFPWLGASYTLCETGWFLLSASESTACRKHYRKARQRASASSPK